MRITAVVGSASLFIRQLIVNVDFIKINIVVIVFHVVTSEDKYIKHCGIKEGYLFFTN
ncbi:hypothetical protein M3651_26770 [Cytobacillus oceanisediminis]|nr:hypothetical protein [Cytobacillus oceanisediminis]